MIKIPRVIVYVRDGQNRQVLGLDTAEVPELLKLHPLRFEVAPDRYIEFVQLGHEEISLWKHLTRSIRKLFSIGESNSATE